MRYALSVLTVCYKVDRFLCICVCSGFKYFRRNSFCQFLHQIEREFWNLSFFSSPFICLYRKHLHNQNDNFHRMNEYEPATKPIIILHILFVCLFVKMSKTVHSTLISCIIIFTRRKSRKREQSLCYVMECGNYEISTLWHISAVE